MKEEVIYTVEPTGRTFYRLEEFFSRKYGQDPEWYLLENFLEQKEAIDVANTWTIKSERPMRVVKVTASE